MGAGWPCPHPTAVTPAHGAGIGFLQPHPGPAGRGDGVGTVTEPHIRTPGWPLGKGQEGDKYKLSKKELKELLQSELGCFLETQKDAGAVEKIMQDLDENGDGEVDFQEFVVLVAALTVACNTFFWENA
ncbi:protein S100-A1 isoform X2 [Serinus canaria]|uniref:protein S100-A1 isoform X2 n=1 Tax=Serinus canaria TaxID=9135 RepID=UPI0021CCF2A9|nr:protein S100-A1 isoform X2 [Serinus canaria]